MTRPRGFAPGGLETVLFAAGTAALLGLAVWLRLRPLDSALLDGDSFHVWGRALAILSGQQLPWRGEGEGFHFGALQAYLVAPLFLAADGLRDGIEASAVLHALGVLPLALAGRRLAGAGAGLAAGLLYASWPMLVQHPGVGAWTYHAPLLTAVAAWALVELLVRDSRWAAPSCGAALAGAASLHPFALALAAGALATLPWLVRRRGWRPLIWGGAAFGLVLAPMVLDNAVLRFAEPQRAATYSLVAHGEIGLAALVRTGPLEAYQGWPRWLALPLLLSPPLIIIPLLWPRWRRESPAVAAVAAWFLTSVTALLGMGLGLRYLQPYHWAVVAPLQALAVGAVAGRAADQAGRWLGHRLGESRDGRAGRVRRTTGWVGAGVGLLFLAAGLPTTLDTTAPLPSPGQLHLAPVERVAAAIMRDSEGAPVALALLADTDRCAHGQIDAFHAELSLRGADVVGGIEAPRHGRRRARAYVVAEMAADAWERWGLRGRPIVELSTGQGTVLRTLAFADVATAERWLALACPDPPSGLRISRLRDSLGGMPGSDEDPVRRSAQGEFRTFCGTLDR